MQAAGLAASPTGAIQLAYMARNAGAPAGAIADIFSNLPFVQAALKGETLPGFGVPEQLGGGGTPIAKAKETGALVDAALGGSESSPVENTKGTSGSGDTSQAQRANATDGDIFKRGLGVDLPSLTSFTEQQFGGMKDSEKLFLGALYQSETGVPIEQALSDIQKSFVPTGQTSRLSF